MPQIYYGSRYEYVKAFLRLSARFYLELAGGLLLIVFGALFLRYLPLSISEIATDAIFIGAGVLMIRKSILDLREAKLEQVAGKKNNKKSQVPPGPRKPR